MNHFKQFKIDIDAMETTLSFIVHLQAIVLLHKSSEAQDHSVISRNYM